MSVAVRDLGGGAIELNVEGQLQAEDYEDFEPLVEDQIERNGAVNLLVRVGDLSGWSPAAMWEDLKFDVKHYDDVSRLAIVGKERSDKWMATVSKPFTTAEVEFFPERSLQQARAWVQGLPAASSDSFA